MTDRRRGRHGDEGSAGPLGGGDGILHGVRVLDLTWGMAGAICSMLLADHGAEVIVAERPGGGPLRDVGGLRTWSRGKRNVVIDLTLAGDVTLLHELASGADIVIDGLGEGRADALGIGFDSLTAADPGVIYCTLTGGGLGSEPHLGYDPLAAARFGVMAESPGHRDGPIYPAHPAVAYGTAFIATIAILAALRARLATGVGDHIDASAHDGVLSQMTMNWWSERGLSFVQSRERTGRLDMGRRRLLLNRYRCADGVIVHIHTGAAGAFARALVALGLEDRISEAAPGVETASELTDEDLAIIENEIPTKMASASSTEWMQRFWAHEVACLPIQPPGAVFSDDQVVHAGLMQEIDDPDLGRLTVVGPPMTFSATPARIRSGNAALDADGAAIRRAGWQAAGLGRGVATDAPLEQPLAGVRLVELAVWFASPSGNRLLADLGADVVKVEPLQGDPIRPLPDPCEGANGGKRSVAIDMKAPGGRELVLRLIARADVLQHNMRPGAAERLGIDEPAIRALDPDIIYAYSPGYGSTGPKAQLQSFAPLMSGFVGLMHVAAGEGNEPNTCFGNEDYYAGLMSATAILLALVHRERTGQGQYVETPQLTSSVFVTSEHFVHGGEVHAALGRLDTAQTTVAPGIGIAQCLDGWICFSSVTDAQRDALRRVVLGVDHAGPWTSTTNDELTYELFGRTVEEWIDALRAAGVPVETVRESAYLRELLRTDDALARGAAVEIEHPIHGTARVIGELVHLRRRPWVGRHRSPLLGEHTEAVLTEIGCEPDEIEDLVHRGVVVQHDGASGVTATVAEATADAARSSRTREPALVPMSPSVTPEEAS